jgi:5'-3' exonuclease
VIVTIVDGKNALFRFGFANRTLSADGFKTGAIHGMMNCLLRIKKRYDSRFVIAWDGENPREGWRYKLFPGYKDKDKEKPVPAEVIEILAQVPVIQKLCSLLAIPQVQVASVEADDVISLLARTFLSKGYQVHVYSSDADFVQLMDLGVQLVRDINKTDKLHLETIRSVQDRFRCDPKDVIKVRALCGDSSDRIPNVRRGMGPVTAAAYVSAGVDPGLPYWDNLTDRAKNVAADLKDCWELAHRNYQITKLADRIQSPHFTSSQQALLRLDLLAAMRGVAKPIPVERKEALHLLGRLQLVMLISERQRLFRLSQ